MYLITTRFGVTKRLEIPDGVADAEAYAATVDAETFSKAETVSANWPLPDPAPVVAPEPATPAPAPFDDDAFTDTEE